MRSPIVYLIVAGTLFSVLYSQPANPQPETPRSESSIAGQVLNAADGEPLKKVSVSLTRQGGAAYQPRQKDVDASGRFEFTHVEPGQYTLSAERTGFMNQSYGASRPGRPGGSIITIAAGQKLKGLQIKLARYGVALGRVVDEDGDPIAGAYLTASHMNSRGEISVGYAVTNDVGEYRMPVFRPGTYIMLATLRRDLRESAPEPDSDAKELDFVATYHPSSINPSTARQFQVKSGDETRGVDIQMVRTAVVRVRGVVLNGVTGRPIPAAVVLRPTNRGFGGISSVRRTSAMEPVGNFELRGVLPGEYRLAAFWNSAEGSMSSVRTLLVGGENVRDVVMTLASGATLQGILTVEGDRESADPGSEVFVKLSTASGYTDDFGDRRTEVKPDGSFTIRDVPSGRYFVDADRVKGGYLKSARLADQDVLDKGLEIQAGAIAETLHLVVSTRYAEVSGTVRDGDGRPRSGATAVLLPEAQFREERDCYGLGTTDQYGAFTITNVRPGKYKLIALEEVDGAEWMDAEFTKPHEKSAITLTLEEGQKESRQLTLRPGNSTGN